MTTCANNAVQREISLAPYSTFKIGGPARYFARIQRIVQLRIALRWAQERALPILVIGRGSNCLFDDRGFAGLVIFNDLRAHRWDTSSVLVEGGYSLARLAVQSARRGFGGLEFACGIPGSVGGGVYMNAGAHGASIGEVLADVEWVDAGGSTHSARVGDLAFGYRTSPFQEHGVLIWRARFSLRRDWRAWDRCREWLDARARSQPWKERSAGCIFRNAPDLSAGALIQQHHLMGARVGDAQVSQKHANYIVNRGRATSRDVNQLIEKIRAKILQQSSRHLELEVLQVPYSPERPGFWVPPRAERRVPL